MILDAHPMVTKLHEVAWPFHLIGSRFVGKFDEKSDYDYYAAVSHTEWQKLREWLKEQGFAPQNPNTYGDDNHLHGTDVWTWKGGGTVFPPVDVLPMEPEEAAFRLRWLRAMKDVGDKTGLIALGLKREVAWPLFWDTLRRFLNNAK